MLHAKGRLSADTLRAFHRHFPRVAIRAMLLLRGVIPMVLSALLFAIAAVTPAPQAKPLPDAKQLLNRMLDNEKKLEEQQERYSCKVRSEIIQTDNKGNVKKTETKEEEQFFVNGHEIDRTLSKNGQPLDAHAEKKEDERVSKEAAKYSDPSQRIKAENEDQKQIEAAIRMMKTSDERRATVNDRPTIFFHLTGNPNAKPKDLEERFMQSVNGTLAMDEDTGELLDLDIKTDKDVKVGGGLVGDLHKGFKLHIRQAPQPDGIWLTELVEGSGDARAALFYHPYFRYKQQNSGCQLYTVQATSKTKSPGK
jgi:hypothetical protein